MSYLDINDILPKHDYYVFKGGRGSGRNFQYIVLNDHKYEWLYGGTCWIDYTPQTMIYTIFINNDDVGNFKFSIDSDKAKYCTPDLIFNRIDEMYRRALDDRSKHYYEDYTREILGRW